MEDVCGEYRREPIEPTDRRLVMRKLAPLFITTSVLALAAGNVLANNTMGSTDKNGSPTVSDNTNKQPLSYSDKSNTAKGTNARIDEKASIGAAADTSTTGTTMGATGKKVDAQNSFATDEDKRDVKPSANAGDKSDLSADKTAKPAKAKKAKVAKHDSKMHKDTAANGSTGTVTDTQTEAAVKNPPLSATKAEAANSITGKSAGGQ
jgi:hypothetical protein